MNKWEMDERYKEKAATIGNLVNLIGFDNKKFCSEMSCQHKTLQQNFTRMCIAWLEYCATDEYGSRTDGRNEDSHIVAREIMKACRDNDIEILLNFV